ncbi:MAG: tRNA (N(6)-L-threonylcarbamoyladenosine(37)-C(2))-methylthiotransferase MtaB [Clostridiales bacterium]|nr:tRNA (N(6)-L-threonylcarbamoyladenosine(37)-C(2))-methylthiotransferase MtaB [Candidatus Crickella caballi]
MRVAFHTLGCKVNQYETEAMKEAFVSRGAEIVDEDEVADVYIVNTCTVTNIADRKSRQYIRRMKGVNPEAVVVVTGCYAQTSPEEVSALPEVDLVIGNGLKSGICNKVYEYIEGKSVDNEVQVLERNNLNYYEDMGLVASSESGMTRAYIKIQEGCDRFCAYCLIPFARGPVRSRPPEEIVAEATMLLDAGYKEIVLTGINTALYGTEAGFECDRKPEEEGMKPIELIISRLDSIDREFRIRLSSLEPTVVDKNDVERIIRFDKLCHHLHLSVQSGSSKVIKAMNRHYTQEDYLDIVKAIRRFDPLYGITTDIIVGFSGETEDDFEESIRTVHEAEFGKVHVFRYSKRKGTVGEKLPDEVPGTVKNRRSEILAEAADAAARAFMLKNLGARHKVLVEEKQMINEREYLVGYTGNYIRAYIENDSSIEVGAFVEAELCELMEDGCLARV